MAIVQGTESAELRALELEFWAFKAVSRHLCLGEFLYAVIPSWFLS